MRLICPNCGAQYEVPDEVIPFDGRDVQCSNCGDTWFFGHPDNPDSVPGPEEAEVPAQQKDVAGPDADVIAKPEPTRDEPSQVRQEAGEVSQDDAPDQQQEAFTAPATERPGPDVDSGITDILREEARREAGLRAAESGTLESQGDLGLDDVGGSLSRTEEQTKSRTARLRGETARGTAGSRRDLLPDIEEINSAWNASGDGKVRSTEVTETEEQVQKQRSGFVRGFAIILIIGVFMALLYINAPKIAAMVPAAEPALNSYVAMIDQGRVWVDSKLGDMVPDP